MSVADDAAVARRPSKRASAFRTIGEVAGDLDVPAHVLRFWESKFSQLKPLKRAGGRRYYRPEDVQLLERIRRCLYQDGYTIRGVQRLLSEGPSEETTSAPALLLPEGTATLFPLEPPLSSTPPPGKQVGRSPAGALPPEVRAALEEIRRDLLGMRKLVERLKRGSNDR